MKVLLTGAAGFIGMHCAERLLARGDTVIPPGVPTYDAHATTRDGHPLPATVFETCHRIKKA